MQSMSSCHGGIKLANQQREKKKCPIITNYTCLSIQWDKEKVSSTNILNEQNKNTKYQNVYFVKQCF